MNANPKITRWSDRIDPGAPAARVIDKFGGLSAFCKHFTWATSTVHDWLVKGLIPQAHWPMILQTAKQLEIELDAMDFVDQRNG